MNFDSLVTTNYKQLLGIAVHITGCQDKGHDLMNDAYIHLRQKDVVLKSEQDFVKYYRVCMRNLWLDSLKKRKIVFVDAKAIDIHEGNDEFLSELELFKKKLPLHERYLYELYFEEDMSIRMIADECEISPSYIFSMINDIKVKLKQKWK